MHNRPHTDLAKAQISEAMKEKRSRGLTDLHKHKISETKQRKVEMLREYYTQLEQEIK
jgi:hypothetical protein